jgi:hypothetical protein
LESWVPAKLKQVEEVDTQAEQADWIPRYMAQQDEVFVHSCLFLEL